VTEETTLWERVPVTDTFESWDGAKARHTSAVPIWAFVRLTKAHVRPAPVTAVTVMPADLASVEMNASSSSLAVVVEKEGDVMLVLELERSVDLTWSTAMAPHAGVVARRIRKMRGARASGGQTDNSSVAPGGGGSMGHSRFFQWMAEL